MTPADAGGLVGQAGHQGDPAGPGPRPCGRGHRSAPDRPRPRRTQVDPHYPDPTAAFIPQFFGGIKAEADAVEHYERLERRTRQTYRLGAWVTPRVMDFALKQTEAVSEKANRVFQTSTFC